MRHFHSPNLVLVCLFPHVSASPTQWWSGEVYMLTDSLTACSLHCYARTEPKTTDIFINVIASENVWVWIHTSWVWGNEDRTAEGFGFAGGIGGFGFMIWDKTVHVSKKQQTQALLNVYTQIMSSVKRLWTLFTGFVVSGGRGLDGGSGLLWKKEKKKYI